MMCVCVYNVYIMCVYMCVCMCVYVHTQTATAGEALGMRTRLPTVDGYRRAALSGFSAKLSHRYSVSPMYDVIVISL